MSRYIDADALILHLNDYALQESPTEGVSEKFYGYQRGIYLAIQQCICAVEEAPTIDAVEVVRCKDCKWYDSPHIEHNDGTRTDVDEDAPMVSMDVGINVGGKCIPHIDLKIYCTNHDRENLDDYEKIVIFRKPDDFCSYGERKESE